MPTRLLEPTLSLQTATMRSSAFASSISVSAKALRQSNVRLRVLHGRVHHASSLSASSTCSGGRHLVVPLDAILDEGDALAFDRVGDDAARLAGCGAVKASKSAAWSWPSQVDDVPPESAPLVAERLEPIGVLGACALLQAVAVDDRRRDCRAGDGRRTSPLPSWSLPAARRRRARRRFASWPWRASEPIALPTPIGRPWPSGPVFASTPGTFRRFG